MAVDDDGVALLELARPSSWARDSPLCIPVSTTPTRGVAATAYQSDNDHWDQCKDEDCARCFFEHGFRGELRRGTKAVSAPNDALSWGQKFVFTHPTVGLRTWLCVKPRSFPGGFGIGCWICHHFPQKHASSFSKLAVSTRETMGPSSFGKHAESPSHQAAVREMNVNLSAEEARTPGHFTGATDVCPRLDKFLMAGQVIARKDSFEDFRAYMQTLTVSSAMLQKGAHADMSPQTCHKLVLAMAKPLYSQDQAVFRKAGHGSSNNS